MHNDTPRATTEYLTISAAARRLGITEAAVRQRVRRGTLASERLDGRIHVVVSGDATSVETAVMQQVETAVMQQALQGVIADVFHAELAPTLEQLQRQAEEIGRLRAELDATQQALDMAEAQARRRWWRFWR